MKNSYKLALLAALGLASASAIQAQTLLGFNDANGTANDYVIDLGAGSQFTPTAVVDLSGLFNSTMFNTAFGGDSGALNNVAVGLVSGGGSGQTLIQSYAGGSPSGALPSGTPSVSLYHNAIASASGITLGVESSATTSGGWSYQIAQSPILGGADGAPSLGQSTGNPMGTLGSGVIDLTVYEATDPNFGNRGETTTAWLDIGTLAVDAGAGTINFTGVSAVPEPTTLSLLTGAGALLLAFRNKLKRKQS